VYHRIIRHPAVKPGPGFRAHVPGETDGVTLDVADVELVDLRDVMALVIGPGRPPLRRRRT
jgi:hypothetical protein